MTARHRTSGQRCGGGRATRRDVLALASIAGLEAVAGSVATSAFAEPADERPKRGDLLVPIEGTEVRPLAPADITATPLLAWPMDPAQKIVRNGSRLNKVLLVALDPSTLVGADARAGGGRRRRLFGDLSACGLRGQWMGRRARRHRMCLSQFALQSARRRGGGRRSVATRLVGAAARDRRRQARRGQAVHRTARRRTGLIRRGPARNELQWPKQDDRTARASVQEGTTCSRHGNGCTAQRLPPLLPVFRRRRRSRPSRRLHRRRREGPVPDVLSNYASVTSERLRKPEDGNWLLFRRTYDGWGYSPLSQITPANVGRLQLVWSFATGQVEGHQAPPIVNNGVMFVATPGNQVIAIDGQDRHRAVALQTAASGGPDQPASDQPRRRSLWRQAVLRIGRRQPRRHRCQDRQGEVGDQGRRLPERLLHVDHAAGGRRQSDARHLRRRVRRARLRRGL